MIIILSTEISKNCTKVFQLYVLEQIIILFNFFFKSLTFTKIQKDAGQKVEQE